MLHPTFGVLPLAGDVAIGRILAEEAGHNVINQQIWDTTETFLNIGANLDQADITEVCLNIDVDVPNPSGTGNYEKDAILGQIRTSDDQGGGNRGVVAIGARATIASSTTGAAAWGFNAIARIVSGGDGFLVGAELNLDIEGSPTDIKEPGSGNQKIGLKITTKEGKATAAIDIDKGAGVGFFQGVYLEQGDLVNDTSSRAFQYKDLFEIHRDGVVTIGKGTQGALIQGVQLTPTGDSIFTDLDDAVLIKLTRDDTSTPAAANISDIIFLQGDNQGTPAETVYARIRGRSTDTSNTAEDGALDVRVMSAASEILALSLTGGTGANPLNVRVNSTLKQVTQGANNDEAGAGFKWLRVPN